MYAYTRVLVWDQLSCTLTSIHRNLEDGDG